MRKNSILVLAILLGLFFSFQGFAASPPRLFSEERFVVNFGALFAQNIESTLALRGTDGMGDSVTLEDIFGFSDSETVPFVNGWWRFGSSRKHRFIAGWSAINRDSSATIMEDLDIGGTIFPVNARVDVEFDVSLFRVAYAYSFVLTEKTEFAGMLGFHWVDYGFGIRITDLSSKAPIGAKGSVASESGNVDGPFPNVGLELRHAFTPNFRGQATIRWFDIELGDFDGSITDFSFGGTYQFNRTFGLALDWAWFEMDVGVNSNDWRGSLNYKYNGPVLTGNLQFGN